MRQAVLDYIKGLNLGSYTVSEEIPRVESGTPMYVRNPKKIYVDANAYSDTPLISTLSGLDIYAYSTSVSLFFANDAKTVPNNYDSLVGNLIFAKDVDPQGGYTSREAVVTTTIETDLLVTQIDLTYTKLR
jgi:hypothetical protein